MMICPKCNSENVVINESVYQKKKGSSLIYKLLIGWWLEIIMPWEVEENEEM